ncbi:MAG: phospholipid carrier-dependent glycosyltransferase [Desulfobulbaceae bacterium]|nr:phospholipid carrier-dependent glycosyltransferase [Desulfobulbaceae bacterium]
MTSKSKLNLLILSLFIAIYLFPLGARPLMEPDETRYGEVPREMIASGNWISPHLNGLRYFEKPPLGYWLNGISIMAFGENAFAVRLPSALSVGLSTLLIMLIIRQACLREEIWAASIAGFVFLTCLEVTAIGTFSILDSMLACTLTLTMSCFFLASQAQRGSSRQRWLLIGAGISCGLAFLTKGFLALVVPAISMGAYLIWERRFRDLIGLAWLPLLIATLTALPWSLAIHAQQPDFWNFFFWHEHVQRFLGGNKAQHAESFWFFFISAPAMFLPWTFLVPAAALGLQKDTPPRKTSQLIRFSLCWLCLPFLFFSLSSGKLLTYILPCFPPFAILVSLGLLAGLRSGRQRLFQFGACLLLILFGVLALAFIAIQVIGINGVAAPYSKNWQWLLALVCLTSMTLLPLAAYKAKTFGNKIILYGLSMTLLLGMAPFIMPDLSIEKKSPGSLLRKHKEEVSVHTIVLSDEDTLRAVCWFLKRADVLLIEEAGELTYGMNYADVSPRLLDLTATKSKILANPNNIVLIARARNYRRWADKLPLPREIDDSGRDGYVFLRY